MYDTSRDQQSFSNGRSAGHKWAQQTWERSPLGHHSWATIANRQQEMIERASAGDHYARGYAVGISDFCR